MVPLAVDNSPSVNVESGAGRTTNTHKAVEEDVAKNFTPHTHLMQGLVDLQTGYQDFVTGTHKYTQYSTYKVQHWHSHVIY